MPLVKKINLTFDQNQGGIDMKKVLVTIGALAIALSASSTSFAASCCNSGSAAPFYGAGFNYGYTMPSSTRSSYAYYQQIAPKCCRTIVSPCCGAAAPVEPCGCGCAKPTCGCEKPACGCGCEKPKCGCEKAKKHLFKRHHKKACKCKS